MMKRIVPGLAAILAVAAMAAPAAAVTNFVTDGGFESTSLTSSGQLSSDSGVQRLTYWYNGSTNGSPGCLYSYPCGTTAGYAMLLVNSNASHTGSAASLYGGAIKTNDYGSIAMWGQVADSAFNSDVKPHDNGSPGAPRNQVVNGFSGDTIGTGGNFVAADGAYQVGPIVQQINGLTVGKVYKLSFDWGAAQQYGFDGSTTEGWTVNFTGAHGNQTASTATVTNPNHGFTPWSTVSYFFTATDASEYLSFFATGGPSGGQPPFSLLDNVSLIETPEPASWMTMIMGFGLVGATMRRRRTDTAKA